jgi:pimeloyl-ACP methyl ester carboxylesterase
VGGQWAKIRCPILELNGAESSFLSPEIADRVREAQPNMQFVEVPRSGHPIAADNPAFLLRELRRFLVD